MPLVWCEAGIVFGRGGALWIVPPEGGEPLMAVTMTAGGRIHAVVNWTHELRQVLAAGGGGDEPLGCIVIHAGGGT